MRECTDSTSPCTSYRESQRARVGSSGGGRIDIADFLCIRRYVCIDTQGKRERDLSGLLIM